MTNRFEERVFRLWEPRVLEKVSAASSQSKLALSHMVPELLQNLLSNISASNSHDSFDAAGKIGTEHGKQRANLIGYTFSQVLLEYQILRQAIFEVLKEDGLLTDDVRDMVLNTLDEGIKKTVEEFSSIRSEELNRSNRDLEHFAAIAAHDLKSPLATIIGFSELLEESLQERLEMKELEYLRSSQRSAARMTLLIDRLLEYSSIGKQTRNFEVVSTEQIVRDVTENLKTIFEKSNATLSFLDLPVVYGDISLLSQLFQNFISNSLKFRDPKRPLEILIEAKDQEKSWLFSVHDNGSGFDEKDKENIFSLFKQLDGATARIGQGIGLATARKVIEIHGGIIWAESQLGVGSVFYFTLPKVLS